MSSPRVQLMHGGGGMHLHVSLPCSCGKLYAVDVYPKMVEHPDLETMRALARGFEKAMLDLGARACCCAKKESA